MKKFEYDWDKDFFLLHVQMNNVNNNFEATLCREYDGGTVSEEKIKVNDEDSFRFIVSKTHPKEKRFTISYPDENTIEVFKVDDRAYYPTESFYVG